MSSRGGRSRGSSRGFLPSRGNFGMSKEFKYKNSMHSSRDFEGKRHESFDMREERPSGKRREYSTRDHHLEKNESRHSIREGHDDSHISSNKMYHSKFMNEHSPKSFNKEFYPSHNPRGRDSFRSRGTRESFRSRGTRGSFFPRGRGFTRGSSRGFRNDSSFVDYQSRSTSKHMYTDGGMPNFKNEIMDRRRPFRSNKEFSDNKEYDREKRYNKYKDNEDREFKDMRSWNDRPYKKSSLHFDSDPRSRKRFKDFENPPSKYMRFNSNYREKPKSRFYEEEEIFSDDDIENRHKKRVKYNKEIPDRSRRSKSGHEEEQDHKRESSEDSKKRGSSSSGVQVTIRRDGERAVKGEGQLSSRFSGKLFIDLRCPHCPGQRSITFQEYRFHLDSKKHELSIRELAYKHSLILRKIRLQQRNEQKEMEEQWSKDKPSEFESSVSRYCKGCKLAFKCNGEDDSKEISAHNESKLHKVQQQYLFPRCPMCSMSFPSRMGYEYHIASIRHLRRKAETKEEDQDGNASDEPEIDDVNLDDFITMDSVEGDEDLGSEHDEITGNTEDLKASKEEDEEEHNGDKKSHHEEEEEDVDEEGKSDDEGSLVGKEFIIPVDAAYCKLCREFIHLEGKKTTAVEEHCRGFFHTRSYKEHMTEFDMRPDLVEGDEDNDDHLSDEDDMIRQMQEDEDMECLEFPTPPRHTEEADGEKNEEISEDDSLDHEDKLELEDEEEDHNQLEDHPLEDEDDTILQEVGETMEGKKLEVDPTATSPYSENASHKKSSKRTKKPNKS